jgi:hypothetical protein
MDGKVHGTLIKNKDGVEIPEDEFIVLRPGDNAVPATLQFYRDLLVEQGASEAQVKAVIELQVRVDEWRRRNPERCKVADVESGEIRT